MNCQRQNNQAVGTCGTLQINTSRLTAHTKLEYRDCRLLSDFHTLNLETQELLCSYRLDRVPIFGRVRYYLCVRHHVQTVW